MTTTQDLLDERYGRRRSTRSRRAAWIVFGAVVAVALAGLTWLTWANAAGAVVADVTAFEVVDEHRVTLTFQVTAPAESAFACALEAQDVEHGVVGWRVVEYPASSSPVQAFTEAIPTLARATTGLVNSCWVP